MLSFRIVTALLFICSFPLFSQAKKAPIKIGTVFPMTGPTATFGQESINGIKLALKLINKQGINGQQIQLLSEDNKGEAIETANAVRKLINVDKVSIVIGSVASSNTLAGAPIAQEAKVPLLTPASTNPAVTKKGKYISRTCFTDDFQGLVMAKFAYQSLKKRKAIIITDNANDYSIGLTKVFRAKFTKMGGKIIAEYSYVQKDTDFRTLLRRTKRKKPDVIFLPGYYGEVGLILRQARAMGITVPFLGGDGWDSPKLYELAGKKGIENNFMSSHFSPDDKSKIVQDFVREYTKAYKEKPGAMSALGHDSILVLANALKRAKSLSTVDIRDAINSTKNVATVTGNISLDKNRNAIKAAVILKTTAKGSVFVEKINP